jgi:hypothetical protein
MAPDTLQNLTITIKLTLFHNWEAIVYLAAWLSALVWSLKIPTRGKILIATGFLLLFFNFQYNKHIVDGLKEQTTNSLITERQSVKTAYILNKTFDRVIPFILPLLGWGLIFGGAWLEKRERFYTVKKHIKEQH